MRQSEQLEPSTTSSFATRFLRITTLGIAALVEIDVCWHLWKTHPTEQFDFRRLFVPIFCALPAFFLIVIGRRMKAAFRAGEMTEGLYLMVTNGFSFAALPLYMAIGEILRGLT
jgi:hypothetical protein